jgi:hypothetical protein
MSHVAPLLPRRFRLLALVAGAGLAVSACGSTAQIGTTLTAGGAASQTSADGQALTVDPQTGLAVTSGSAPGSSTSSGGVSTTGGVSAVPGAVSRPGTSAPAAGPAQPGAVAQAGVPTKGPGWDAKNVYFGIVTQNDAQKAFAAFGANKVDPGNTLAQAQAVATYVNAHGGILGRQLKIVAKDVATVDTATNPESTGGQVCSYFTEDNPVFGVWSLVTVMDYPNFRACLANRHVPLFSAGVKVADDKAGDDLAPYFYQSVMASWTRVGPVLVDRLKAQGYFSGWDVRTGAPGTAPTKVGILTDSTSSGLRIGKLLTALVQKAGYTALPYSYTAASDGQSNSVNYFNQNGVTHVIVTDVELTAFQNSASSQAYKPRYGITSYNDPYTNLEAGGLTPAGANNGAMGVGWNPALDVAQANDPGASPGAAACLKLLKAAGQDLNGKRLAQAFAFSLCDTLELVQQGATRSHSFMGTALAAGLAQAAQGFPTAVGFGTGLTSSRHFVPGVARDLAWHPDCSCFRYGTTTAAL